MKLDWVENVCPVVFGEDASPPAISAVTLQIMLLGVDPVEERLVPVIGWRWTVQSTRAKQVCDNGATMGESTNWKKRIKIDSEIMGGRPVINGTRVPLEVILGALAGGDSIEDVCEGWSITEEDVRAALGYAAHLLRTEDIVALPA